MDDLIGDENGVSLSLSEEEEESKTIERACNNITLCKQKPKQSWRLKKEYPPPISHIPCNLCRNYSDDGRLVLKMELKHPWHLNKLRTNGGLLLSFLPLDDVAESPPVVNGKNEKDVGQSTIGEEGTLKENGNENGVGYVNGKIVL